MAEHIESEQIGKMPVASYEEIRTKLRSGDILFASGDYLVSEAIRTMTNSPWSHVGIVFRMNSIERILLLESVEDMGVRFAPMSKYLSDYENGAPYQGKIVLARCSDIMPSAVAELAKFGINELTRPYDKDEIAKIIARIALGYGRKERDREYICSELVYECFLRANIKFGYNPDGFISPEDIWKDKRISLVCRIL